MADTGVAGRAGRGEDLGALGRARGSQAITPCALLCGTLLAAETFAAIFDRLAVEFAGVESLLSKLDFCGVDSVLML